MINCQNKDHTKVTGPPDEQRTTIVGAFHASVAARPQSELLGHRDTNIEGKPYVWMTYGHAKEYVDNLARGIKALGMMEDI